MLAREVRSFCAQIFPTKTGPARLTYLTAPEKLSAFNPLTIAFGLFLSFLLNPANTRLAGPCKECGEYYLKNARRQLVYCLARCGRKRTSSEANKESREDVRKRQLKLAQRSLNQWENAKTKSGWKDWVLKETRISKNWLIRESRKGLVLPEKALQTPKLRNSQIEWN